MKTDEQTDNLPNPFTTFTEEELQNVIAFFKDETLMHDMKEFADTEDYQMAIIYRNELIRRGKL